MARFRDGWLLRVPDLADVLIADDCRTLRVRTIAALDPGTIEHLLIDQVLPRVLAQQGELMVHSGAVDIDGRVALFIGESGRGKSTWTAILRQQGHRILSDDCVLVRDHGPDVRALPTYPSLRLLPDMLEQLGLMDYAHDVLAAYGNKRRLVMDPPIASTQGLEVAAIYVLQAPTAEGATATIENLSPGKSCIELTRNTFRLDPTDLRRTADLLARTAAVAQRVPAFSLHFPRNVAVLPAYARRVAEHFVQHVRPGAGSSPASVRRVLGRGQRSQETDG